MHGQLEGHRPLCVWGSTELRTLGEVVKIKPKSSVLGPEQEEEVLDFVVLADQGRGQPELAVARACDIESGTPILNQSASNEHGH